MRLDDRRNHDVLTETQVTSSAESALCRTGVVYSSDFDLSLPSVTTEAHVLYSGQSLGRRDGISPVDNADAVTQIDQSVLGPTL